MVSVDWRYIVAEGQTPNEKLEQDLRNLVTASGLPGDDLIVNLVHADGGTFNDVFDLSDRGNDLQLIRIEIQLPYSSVSLFPERYLSGKTLKAFVVMRAAINGGTISN